MTLKVWLSDQISKWSETPSPLDREFSPTTVCGLRRAIGVTLQSKQHQFSFNSENKDTQLTTSAGQRSSRRPIGPIVLVSPITPTSTLTNKSHHASWQTSARWEIGDEAPCGPPVGSAHDDFHKSEQWHHLPEQRLEPMSISTFEIRTWMQSQPHQRFSFKILNWKHRLWS